jgi:hypothetical protein
MISRRKEKYPISPSLLQYLHHFGRRAEIPIVYDDLLRFDTAMPYENPSGRETLWLTVAYAPEVMRELQPKLTRIYAMLKLAVIFPAPTTFRSSASISATSAIRVHSASASSTASTATPTTIT